MEPFEFCKEITYGASQEALELFYDDRIEDFSDQGFRVAEVFPENPELAPYFGVSAKNRKTDSGQEEVLERIAWMQDTFPYLSQVLFDLRYLSEDIEKVMHPSIDAFTLNLFHPGQKTDTHIDTGDGRNDRQARVATLLGSGTLYLQDRLNGNFYATQVTEGSIVSFKNPALISERPYHYGQVSGDGMRISIGLQVLQ